MVEDPNKWEPNEVAKELFRRCEELAKEMFGPESEGEDTDDPDDKQD